MLYGLCGSSGSGKTTLGEMIGDGLGILFQKTSITASAAAHGYNAVGNLALEDRVMLQHVLLKDHVAMITAGTRPMLVDRTPIDMIAYMLCEIGMHSHNQLDAQILKKVDEYVALCLSVTAQHYDFIFHLASLETYEAAVTRPSHNPAYQRHCDLVMRGALAELRGRCNYAMVNTTDLNQRHDFVTDTIVERLDKIEAQKKNARHIH